MIAEIARENHLLSSARYTESHRLARAVVRRDGGPQPTSNAAVLDHTPQIQRLRLQIQQHD